MEDENSLYSITKLLLSKDLISEGLNDDEIKNLNSKIISVKAIKGKDVQANTDLFSSLKNLTTVVYDIICKYSELNEEQLELKLMPGQLLLIQLFRILYKEHGKTIDIEIDLLTDTIMKILKNNFEIYCNDKNAIREGLIIEIIGVIFSINEHSIETFKDELCDSNVLSVLTKLLYVDSYDLRQSFWKLIESLLRSLKFNNFKDEHSAVSYNQSNSRIFLENLIRVVLGNDLSNKNSAIFIINEILSNEITMDNIQKTFGFNFLLKVLKNEKNIEIRVITEKIVLRLLNKNKFEGFSNKKQDLCAVLINNFMAESIKPSEKIVIVLSLALLFKDIEICAKLHDTAFLPLVIDLWNNYSICADPKSDEETKTLVKDQLMYEFFALRYLYSIPKNRQDFKVVFPPVLFMQFISIHKISKSMHIYVEITDTYLNLTENEALNIQSVIDSQKLQKKSANENIFKEVAEYKLIEPIGQGAYGTIYYSQCLSSGDYFAIKEVNYSSVSELQGTMDEVEIMSLLDHPNIIRYHEAFTKAKKVFIVMEYIEGLNLFEYIEALKERDMFIPRNKLQTLILDMISVLKYLHEDKQILHKDLNPSNVMLSFDFKVIVYDFGLSHQISELTRTSKAENFAGTIQYSAPEMVENKFYTEKCDIWSFGCIIYEILESRPVFTGNNPLQLARDISNCNYDRLDKEKYKYLGKFGEKLLKLVELCMEVDIDNRPSSLDITKMFAEEFLAYTTDLKLAQKEVKKVNLRPLSSQSRI